MNQIVNLKKDSIHTRNYLYGSEGEKDMVVDDYNGKKTLLFKIEEEKINNYIKILEDGKE